MKLVVSRTPLRTNARVHARLNAGEIDCISHTLCTNHEIPVWTSVAYPGFHAGGYLIVLDSLRAEIFTATPPFNDHAHHFKPSRAFFGGHY